MQLVQQDLIFHHSHQLFFRSPFGAVPCREKITLRLAVRVPPEEVETALCLRKNDGEEETVAMGLKQREGELDIYETCLEALPKPGLMWYYFRVQLAGNTYYYGNNPSQWGGVGQVTLETVPPAYQITVYDEKAATPRWFKEAVMYQIFVDRFANGCADGTVLAPKKNSLIHAHWAGSPVYIRDARQGSVIRWDFYGGNLLGVLKKLPYLQELGITVIYLNPVFESPSNHKYDTADYRKIDSMYGDNEVFANLCAVAGEMGISVVLDGVFSHTGSDSIYFNKKGTYPGPGAYQSAHSPYYSWYRFSQYPNQYESWWGIDTLPNVNELDPSYQDFMLGDEDSVVKYWMKQGAKGWRLDVVDELPGEFVQMLRREMKKQDPEGVLIGEVWEDASNKVSYGKRREYLLGAELDSVMNYPFRTVLVDFMLGKKDGGETDRFLLSLYENYPLQYFYSTMNLIGSHDLPRILTLLGDAPPGEQLTVEEMSSFRLTPEKLRLAAARLKLLALLQFTFPGVPCIYYGDEAGMEGYGDPLCRGPFPWGQENRQLLAWHKKLIALRHRLDVLKTGSWLSLVAGGDLYGYVRHIDRGEDVFGQAKENNVAVVLANRNPEREVRVEVDLSRWCRKGSLVDIFSTGESYRDREVRLDQGRLTLNLGPLTGKLLLEEYDDN